MAELEVNAVRSIEIHLLILRFFGFYPLDDRHTLLIYVTLHKLYSCIAFVCCFLYVGLEIWYVVENWGDIMETVTVSALLFTHITAFAKQFVLRFKAIRIMKLIDIIAGPLFNNGKPVHMEINKELIRTCKIVLVSYTSCAFVTCCLWAIFPFLEGSDRELPLRSSFPFATSKTPGYEIAFFIQIFVVVVQALVNTTVDALIATLMANACAQIRILCYNLEHITDRKVSAIQCPKDHVADLACAEKNKDFVGILFVKCVEHQKSIIKFVREIENLFNLPVLYQFAASGTIICAIAYRMTYVHPVSIEFISMILFMSCMLTEIFMFCYYGNELFIQSGRISQAIYRSDWLSSDVKLRRSMIIFMERNKRQIKITSGKLADLSLSTFVVIIKFSYTCFAVLHGTKNNNN